jgi:predicted acetyltransferase
MLTKPEALELVAKKLRQMSAPDDPVEIVPALREQEPILANLLELYIYDFSEFMDVQLRADGRFGYERLPLYWKEPNHYPFLITVNGDLAGFVFVRRGSQISGDEDIWDVAEFFVVRGYRRLRVGMKAAHEVWKKFPGKWEVRVINRNQRAQKFWPRAIEEFLGKTIAPIPFEKNGEGWYLFTFESKGVA